MTPKLHFEGILAEVRNLPLSDRVGYLLDIISDIYPEDQSVPEIDALGLNLAPTPYAFLRLMHNRLGETVSKDSLYAYTCARKPSSDWPLMKTIDVQICGLRKKLQGSGWKIETIHGCGYRLTISQQEFPSMGTADVGAVTSTPTYLPVETAPGA